MIEQASGAEPRDWEKERPQPVSLVKDILFVVDLLVHAGAGEIDLQLRATPFVIADRWLVRRFLLRAMLPLLPPEPGPGKLSIVVTNESSAGVIRATHPARLNVSWSEPTKLVRELGGDLDVESSPERGTAVTIRVPLAAMRLPRKESSCATSDRTSHCA